MLDTTLIVLAMLSALGMLLTVAVYERHLAEVRLERDELLDILDANVDDMRQMAADRHPSARADLKVVK